MSPSPPTNPGFDATRVEDYLEVIYDLIQTKGYARATAIAERLGVRPPSVTSMLQRLHGLKLIVYERYRGLTLTPKGERLAKNVQHRHLTILKFLRALGIKEGVAMEDAEGIEHHANKTTIERIDRFVEFIEQHPSWFRSFADTLK